MLARIEASFGAELPLTIERLLNTVKQDSIVATVISLGGVLLAASILFKYLRLAFRAIWKYKPLLVSDSMSVMVRETILERVIASGFGRRRTFVDSARAARRGETVESLAGQPVAPRSDYGMVHYDSQFADYRRYYVRAALQILTAHCDSLA